MSLLRFFTYVFHRVLLCILADKHSCSHLDRRLGNTFLHFDMASWCTGSNRSKMKLTFNDEGDDDEFLFLTTPVSNFPWKTAIPDI